MGKKRLKTTQIHLLQQQPARVVLPLSHMRILQIRTLQCIC